MPEVSSIGNGPVGPVNRNPTVAPSNRNGTLPAQPDGDRVELSERAQHMDETSKSAEIRPERIESLRHAIESGSYDTEERLNVALERLIEDLQG